MRRMVLTCWLVVMSAAGNAFAAGDYPDEYALRPLQLPAGMVQLKVPVIVNLSRGSVGSPVWIPFEIRLGLTPDFELRVFHPVHGLCVSGRAHGCGRVYDDLGVGMLYSVMREQAQELSLLVAFEVPSFSDPALLRLDIGMAWKLVRAPFSIAAWPYIGLGLNRRDQNGDSFNAPVELAFQLSYDTALFLETGFYGGLHGFADDWSSPLGVGINHLVGQGVDIGAEFKLTGPIHGSSDGRLLLVYFALRN